MQELVSIATTLISSIPVSDNHSVAAAAWTRNNELFTGVNVLHFTGGPCAELVLLGNVAAAGVPLDQLTMIVAVANESRGVIPPCGRCRQVLIDLCPRIYVVMPVMRVGVLADSEDGDSGHEVVALARLLPGAYRN